MLFPYHIIDLTHDLDSNIPTWDGNCGFKQNSIHKFVNEKNDNWFCVQTITMQAGAGTHIDAPAHCIAAGVPVEKIELENLIASCVVINVEHKAVYDYQVTPNDIIEFETIHGFIEPKSFVIIYTGWSRYWKTREKYINNHEFPSITKETAELLLKRDIVGIGIDTLSPDKLGHDYPVHKCILSQNKYIIENIAHANQLPAKGSYTLALPIKTVAGTEAPIRLIGLIPHN